MNITFDTYDEYQSLWNSVHDSIIYWKKVYQMTQGKINLNVDGSPTHYDAAYAVDKMVENALNLKTIEDSTRPEWDEETETYKNTTGVSCYSHIILKTLKTFGGWDVSRMC